MTVGDRRPKHYLLELEDVNDAQDIHIYLLGVCTMKYYRANIS